MNTRIAIVHTDTLLRTSYYTTLHTLFGFLWAEWCVPFLFWQPPFQSNPFLFVVVIGILSTYIPPVLYFCADQYFTSILLTCHCLAWQIEWPPLKSMIHSSQLKWNYGHRKFLPSQLTSTLIGAVIETMYTFPDMESLKTVWQLSLAMWHCETRLKKYSDRESNTTNKTNWT